MTWKIKPPGKVLLEFGFHAKNAAEWARWRLKIWSLSHVREGPKLEPFFWVKLWIDRPVMVFSLRIFFLRGGKKTAYMFSCFPTFVPLILSVWEQQSYTAHHSQDRGGQGDPGGQGTPGSPGNSLLATLAPPVLAMACCVSLLFPLLSLIPSS